MAALSTSGTYRTGTLPAIASGCPLLSRLRLDGRLPWAEVVAAIEALTQLVEFDFVAVGNGTGFVAPLMAALARHCGTLELLALHWARGLGEPQTEDVELFDGRPPFTNLREVRLGERQQGPSASDADLRRLFDTAVKLECLHISTHRLTSFQNGQHPKLKRLTFAGYFMQGEPFTVSTSSIMTSFPRLECLDMRNDMTQWQDDVGTQVHTSCGAMMKIAKLPSCNLTDAALSILLDGCPQLEVLDISQNAGLTTLARTSGEYERLQHLDISQCRLLESIALSFPRLEELRATGCSRLTALPISCPRLEKLHASYCSRLTALPISCPRLRTLDLSSSGSPALFEGLSVLMWPLLEVLLLDRCSTLTDSQLLSCIDGRYRLQNLDLAECKLLTDAAMTAIVHNCPRLRQLNVNACRGLTADAVGAIGRLRHLESLHLIAAGSRLIGAVDQLCQQRPILETWNIRRVPLIALTAVLNLKVVTQDGNEIWFKLACGTKLWNLMNAFCQSQGVQMNSIRFLFDGCRISGDEFPYELEMEDGDSIDAMVEASEDELAALFQ